MAKGNAESFSRRHGLQPPEPPVTVWDDAPEDFRYTLLSTANEKCGLRPFALRDIVCGVLRKRPDPGNWSEYPNVWGEVEGHVHGCEWFRVYDITEAIRAYLVDAAGGSADTDERVVLFDEELNTALRELGVGWQIRDGLLQARGDEAFEKLLENAKEVLLAAGKATAHNELREALKDISRRPEPDSTGAIQHAMAALECVAKDITGQPNATLGQILSRNAAIVPKPLDQAVDKVWGFASDRARHVREGQAVGRHEAHLVVGLAAALANYLVHKAASPS